VTADLHTLTGAYALDALSGREAREFSRHLARCPACAQEVAELRETAVRLSMAVAEVPPAALRARVMAALPDVRQLPPPPRRTADVVPLRGRTWRQRLPYLAAAACLAGAVVSGGVAVDAAHDADRARARTDHVEQQAAQLTAVLAAPDAAYRTRALSGGGNGTVVASARAGRAAFVFRDLPRLSGSRVYQLWFGHHGAMTPAGLVEPDRRDGAVLLAGSSHGADGVGVTVEPHGGSRQPTTRPVLLVSIPG